MPKIAAATLAEHQVHQRQAIIDAAVSLLAYGGAVTLNVGSVSKRAGLARTSLYQYFDTVAALVATIVTVSCEARQVALRDIDGDPAHAVERYVTRSLDFDLSDLGRAERALTRGDLPEPCREQLRRMRDDARLPLVQLLVAARYPNAALEFEVLDGSLEVGADLIERGTPRKRVEQTLATFIAHYASRSS
jgi:AcrR family transcriptional regulator